MKKLNQFVISSFLGPFVLTLLIVVFILVLQFLWLYIDDLVGKGLSIWIILEFLGWGAATILPLAMPLATLLASIMTLGSMGENNELLAMKAAGISLQRILAPLIVIAFIISVGAFFVSDKLIPVAYNKIYTLQYDIGKTKEEIKIPTGTFYNGIEGYTLRIDSRNKKTNMMYNVMVYNHTANKGNISVALADSGMIKSTPDKKALIFSLYDGNSYDEDVRKSYKDTTFQLREVEFKSQELIIPLENYNFEKSSENRYNNAIMAKNLKTLLKDKDSLNTSYTEINTKQNKNIFKAIEIRYPKQFDSSVAFSYTKKFETDTIRRKDDMAGELSAVKNAISSVQRGIDKLKNYDNDIKHCASTLRRTKLEAYRKFTLSFACFVLFFIGAPLGALIRKGGLGTPVIISALFFVLYYVIDISGKKLATDGAIIPMVGAFISTIVLLPIGIFLTWKATKDSALFNMDSYKTAMKKISGLLKDIVHLTFLKKKHHGDK